MMLLEIGWQLLVILLLVCANGFFRGGGVRNRKDPREASSSRCSRPGIGVFRWLCAR